jgi:hypothetical protein
LFPQRIWSTYIAPANPGNILENKNLYGVHTSEPEALAVAMNASTTWMFLEIGARSSLGEGVLDIDVNMAEDVLVPTPESESAPELPDVSLRKDIFEQMAAEPGEEISLKDVSSYRRLIDQTALGDWLGMDEKMQRRVCEALTELVGTRIERSDSL